ncbi:MAG: hypothetical protein AAFO07_30525 [Bacteroidota bacterium]
MFNIFKKKEVKHKSNPKTVLCIPGNWNDRNEIVKSIAESNLNEFIFAGMVVLNIKTNKGFELQIEEYDKNLKESFRIAGSVNRVEKEFIEEIGKHKFVVYLIGETGNLKDAKEIAEAATAILKVGGIGVKVETTGKAFTKEHWSELITDFEEGNLYEMFVLDSISDGNGTVYTCGMHNLGYKDAIVNGEEFQDAVELLSIFGYYQIIDKPEIKTGQTFGTSIDSPVFEVIEEKNQPYKGDELFENSFGMWRLKRK